MSDWIGSQTEVNVACEDNSTRRAASFVNDETIFGVFFFGLDVKSEEVSLKVKTEPRKRAASRGRESHSWGRHDWVHLILICYFILPAKHGGSVLLERSERHYRVTISPFRISFANAEETSRTLFNLQEIHSSSYLQMCQTRQHLLSLARWPCTRNIQKHMH